MSINPQQKTADHPSMPLDLYRTHLQRRHLATSTITRYLTDLRAVARWLDPTPITDATTEDLERFLDGRDHQARSRYRWLSELHRFYQWALTHDLTDTDPTARIDRPRLARLLPRPADEADIARAITAAGPTMKAWLVLSTYAGLRCAEIAGLDRASIQPGALRVVGKGGHERIVPTHPEVTSALRGAPMARTGPVFRRDDGEPFSPKEVSRRISAYLDGLGIDSTAHQNRHLFATRAFRVSRDLRAVQELCGHADVGTTASYAAVTAEDLANVVAAIPTLA